MGIIINGLTDTVTAADGSLNIGGDVTIPGELSYDDVTNIDSVGVVTARAGVHVTGGNLAIGHNSPSVNLHVKGSASNGQIYLGGTGAHSQIYADNDGVLILNADQGNSAANSYLGFNVDNTERLRITSDGTLRQSGSNAALGQGDSVTKLTHYTIDGTTPGGVGDVTTLETISATSNGSDYRFVITKREGSGGGSCFINLGGNSDGSISFGTNTSGSGTERLRITSDGKMGLGTQTPADKLSIDGGSLGIYNTGNNHGNVYFYKDGTAKGWLKYRGNDDKLVIGNVTDAINVLSSGNLGIGGLSNPGALLSIPAGESNTPRLAIESAVDDNDFTITQYEDGNGTYTMLGQNVKLNSGGNNTILDSAHRTAGILLDARNHGSIVFLTGGTNAVGENVKIDSAGRLMLGTTIEGFANYGDKLTIANSGHCGMTIRSGTSSYGTIYFSDGDDGSADEVRGFLDYNHSTNTLQLGTNGATRLRIDANGNVLKSDTPAFQCKLSTATGANFNGYLVFNSVRYNIGNHYNSSNGRFTAPVDGRYLFSWYTNMLRDGGTGSVWADWYVNGGAQGNRMYTHYSGSWELIGGTIIMDLNSSDYVQVYTGTSGNWDGGSYGAFSGYLLG